MSLQEKLMHDLQAAMKSEDVLRRETLRMVIASIRNRELEKGALRDEDVIEILRKETKKREDAERLFLENQRVDSAEKEKKEIAIISAYLPAFMEESDVRTAIQKIIVQLPAKELGPVMKAVMAELRGKADLSLVTKIVKEVLG